MADARPTFFSRLAGVARCLFWALLIYVAAQAFFAPNQLQVKRAQALAAFQEERKSRVIVMIHRADRVSVLGAPVGGFIGIEDSESILRAIRLTPDQTPIHLILHTPGGPVLAAEQIARALLDHKGRVTEVKPIERTSDQVLIFADMSRKAQAQVRDIVAELLSESSPPGGAMPLPSAAPEPAQAPATPAPR